MSADRDLLLEEKLNYSFKDKTILHEALTHPSSNLPNRKNYQRLEFLGDSVLNYITTQELFKRYTEDQEGELAKKRSFLVSGEKLTLVAEKLEIASHIRFTDPKAEKCERDNPSIWADVTEALIGALLLDGGYRVASKFVLTNWAEFFHEVVSTPSDPKSDLQEWAQAHKLGLPNYQVIEQIGPAHAPEFIIEAAIGNFKASAKASNKKHAERLAAGKILAQITGDNATEK